MQVNDTQILEKMKALIASHDLGNSTLLALADQLEALRDMLDFRDHEWEHDLTQQIATLDSASSFVPKNESDVGQLSSAINEAKNELLILVNEKLESDDFTI